MNLQDDSPENLKKKKKKKKKIFLLYINHQLR
jgi:hypothetical protein